MATKAPNTAAAPDAWWENKTSPQKAPKVSGTKGLAKPGKLRGRPTGGKR